VIQGGYLENFVDYVDNSEIIIFTHKPRQLTILH
jgi:hypothetical protein